MRRPGADLEKKPEPRVALLDEAQNGDGMKQSGLGLTRAAIEKPTFDQPNRRVRRGRGESTFAASVPDSVVAPVLGAARASAHVDFPVDRYQVASGRWEESTGQIAMRPRSLSRIITAYRQSMVGPKGAWSSRSAAIK